MTLAARPLHRARSLPLFVAAALAATLGATRARAADDEDLGLELVPYSRKVGEHRYESQRDYEGTVKFFKDKFKGNKAVRFYKEVSLPTVKYIHVENTAGGQWSGINISVVSGRVRYFILERAAREKPSSSSPSSSSTKAKPKKQP